MKSERKVISDVVTLIDNKSYLQQDYFKKFALDSVEAMVFYDSFGQKAKKKYVGWLYKWFYEQYYKYVHTSALKLPLNEIEKILENAESLSVGPCPCRLVLANNNLEAPLYTCIHINRFSDTIMDMQNSAVERAKKKGRTFQGQNVDLSKEQAIELVRYLSHDRNMIFSLESCINSYANNLCCCYAGGKGGCIELMSRYDFGLDVCPSGPYVPKFDLDKCAGCGACAKRCPIGAISVKLGKASWNPYKCLGCGNCVESCGKEVIHMEVEPSRVPKWKEPGPIKLLYIKLLARIMFGMFRRYKKTLGKNEDHNRLFAKARPNKWDIIHPAWYDEEQQKLKEQQEAEKTAEKVEVGAQ